jgi:hypothetical protein
MSNDKRAPDRCERCDADLWYHDLPTPVVDASGTHHEHVTEATPGARLWCPDCWEERQTEQRASQNHSIATFVSNRGEQA